MIHVTRLDGSDMVVNVDQIAWIEGMPDTVISLMNGEKLLVREAPEQLIARAKAFKRAVAMPIVRRLGEVVHLVAEDLDTEAAESPDAAGERP